MNRRPTHSVTQLFVVLACLVLSFGSAQADEVLDEESTFDISDQSLDQALLEFSKQADVQIIMAAETTRDLEAVGVHGTQRNRDALERLLADRGLEYSEHTNRTIAVHQVAAVSEERGDRDSGNGRPNQAVVLLAQNQTAAPTRGMRTEEEDESEERAEKPLEEIVVTGTNIRGLKDLPVPSITYTREDIEIAGYGTVEEIFEDLPQNFDGFTIDGGVGEGISQLASQNRVNAAAIDLRGLGPQSTLVLVNGQRRAGGLNGRVVDVSGIPVSAIERIEVVTGGRSAVYGSDAVGGVVNFVLRRSFNGAESQVVLGARDGDGAQRVQTSHIFGRQFDRGGYLATYDYTNENDLDLLETGLVLSPALDGSVTSALSLRPDRRRHSGTLAAEFDLSERVLLYADGMYSRSKTDRRQVIFTPSNSRLTDSNTRTYTTQYNGSAGANVELGAQWGLDISGTLSFAEDDWTDNSTRNGEPEPTTNEITEATVFSTEAVAEGPLPAIGHVVPRMAIGVESRKEDIDSNVADRASDRTIGSVFAELVLPLVEDGTRAGLRRLELSLAGRYDDFSDFGSSFDPQVGLIWEPAAGVKLRGAYSTAFRAPDLYTTLPRSTSIFLLNRPDSTAPSDERPVFQVLGVSNPELEPEEAEGWNAGLDYQPSFAPQVQLSISYFDIDYQDRIISPITGADLALVLERENLFASLVERAPTEEQLRALAATGNVFNLTGVNFDPDTQNYLDVFPDLVYVNALISNIARDSIQGIDLVIDTQWPTEVGDLSFGLNGTYTLQHERNVTPTSPAFSLINEVGKPVDLRLRANAGLKRGAWGGFVFINYAREYDNPLSTPASTMSSWTTVDLTIRYDGSNIRSGLLQGFRAALTVDNIFDNEPPEFLQNDRGLRYDTANADPLGRYLSLRITKHW